MWGCFEKKISILLSFKKLNQNNMLLLYFVVNSFSSNPSSSLENLFNKS